MLSDEQLGSVVIDTAEMSEGQHAVVVRWHDGSEARIAADTDRPSLVFSWAWSVPGRVCVAGITCPDPQLNNIDLLASDPVAGCGGHRPSYAIRILDLAEHSWYELTPDLPLLMGRVVNVVSPGEDSMIVGAGSEVNPDMQALYRIDLRTGVVTPIPEDGEIERVSGCAAAEGILVYLVPPIGLEGQGRGARLALLTDDSAEELEIVGGRQVKLACTDGGMLLWDPDTETLARASVHAEQIRWDGIAVPEPIAGDAFGRFASQRNLGEIPAMWESRGTTFQLWRLDGLTWVRTGPELKGYDPPELVVRR